MGKPVFFPNGPEYGGKERRISAVFSREKRGSAQSLSLWERCQPFGAGGEGEWRVRCFDTFQSVESATALSVTAYAVPALPKGEPLVRVSRHNLLIHERKIYCR